MLAEIHSAKAFSFSGWKTVFLILAALTGFWIRAEYVATGFPSLTSDEVWVYHNIEFQSLTDQSAVDSDFLPNVSNLIGTRKWFFQLGYLFSAHRMDNLPFFACLLSVFLCLFWAFVLVRRTRSWVAGVPLLIFLVFPPPCVFYLGTQFSEARSFYWFGAILVLFAGNWFKNHLWSLAFGLLAVWSCLEDPFTLFFLLPVLWYEKGNIKKLAMENALNHLLPSVLGALTAYALFSKSLPWAILYRGGYLHPALASWPEIQSHASLILFAWPQYWLGRIPWGYLQNSSLGRFLHPSPNPFPDWVSTLIFWILLGLTLTMVLKTLKGKMESREFLLFFLPPILFLVFFIFGNQAWDALTLRYLGFWQYFIPILLGLVAVGRPLNSRYLWVGIMGLWVVFQTFFSVGQLKPHPGQFLAERLEKLGFKTGYSNYWASEVIRYYSGDKLLIAPYDHPPISRQVTEAAQNAPKIALVWIDGLDHPDRLAEVERQLENQGYRPSQKYDFKKEGWSILGFERQASKPPVGQL